MRTHQGTPLGAPLIISSRQFSVPTSAALINGSGPPPLITPTEAGLLYAPAYADFHSQYALTSPLIEYPTTAAGSGVVDTLSTATGGLFGR